MVNSHTSARTQAKDANGTVKRSGAIRPLTDDNIRVAISYRQKNLDNKKYCANVGVVILLVVNVIAFVTLFFHVTAR
jgi:hypothetical protein